MTTTEIRVAGVQSPGDVLDWGVTIDAALLAPGETVVSGSWSLSAAWSAMGVVLTDLGLVPGAGGTLASWARLEVAAAERDHQRWSGAGTIVYPAATLVTSRDRRWWREVPIRIARGAWSATPRVLVIRA